MLLKRRRPTQPGLLILTIALASALAAPAAAAPPANDDFADAELISGNPATASGTNVDATTEAGEPAHGGLGPGGPSVWWRWTAPTSGSVTIRTCGSSFDTVLAVYTGDSVDALTEVTSSYHQGCSGPGTNISFSATSGQAYRIVVDGFGGGTGNISLAVRPPAPNDDFANAELISGNPAAASGTNVGATKEAGEPAHGGGDYVRSVWWRWTAPVSGHVTIDTCDSDFDTLLAVYTGNSVNNLSEVASNDNANIPGCGAQSRVSFDATGGQVYRIAVEGSHNVTGSISLHLRPPPANDDFVNAEPLSGNPAIASGSSLGASKEAEEPDHAGDPGGHSMWWRWTAPVSGHVTIDTCDSDFNTLLAVYTGDSVNNLSEVASNDNANVGCPFGGQSSVSFDATRGQVYRISVDGPAGHTGSVTLAVRPPPPPANDGFADASGVFGQFAWLIGLQNGYATKEPSEPEHAGNAGGHSLWFTWTAPGSGATTVDTCDGDFDTLLAVYRGGTLANLNEVASDDDSCLRQGGSFVEFVAEAGQQYRIAVDGFDGDTGGFDLYVELASDPPPPSPAACADGQDNDGDGRVDLGDPGCSGPADNDERDPVKLGGPTAGNDILTGTAANNLICGLAGSDTIKGLGGNDTLFGDQCGVKAGRTRAHVRAAAAGDGNDRLDGGQGNDKLYGAGGNDRLIGGGGKDRLAGGADKDKLDGGKGHDQLKGGAGNDRLAGGADKDKLDGGKGRDQVKGGAGNDSINARDGIRETVDCGKGKDTVKADKRDRLRGCERVRR